MAHHQRKSSVLPDGAREPHSVSLKVLRLSRPSLANQYPLPTQTSPSIAKIEPTASLAYPSASSSIDNCAEKFVLSPLLTLPPAFGSAYVGNTFSCTLCANNELDEAQGGEKRISNVRIEAEMKTPSSTVQLLPAAVPEGSPAEPEALDAEAMAEDLQPLQSLQRVVNFHLKEEGSHVLAVSVTYSETGASSGRVRTFRKLYQFVAKGCLIVRTKTGRLNDVEIAGQLRKRWALEAQLENVGEETIVLSSVGLEAKPCFKTTSLNWDFLIVDEKKQVDNPVLNPKDVQQVCFLVEESDELKMEPDGRLIIGQLNIGWRGSMGDRGFLTTGWLGTRLR